MRFSDFHNSRYIFIFLASVLAESINKYSKCLTLSYLEALWWSFIHNKHEILHLFVVNLAHHGLDLEAFTWVSVFCNTLKDLITRHGDNTLVSAVTNHRVTLACPRLPVRKQTCMKSIPCLIKYINSNLFKDILLILVI